MSYLNPVSIIGALIAIGCLVAWSLPLLKRVKVPGIRWGAKTTAGDRLALVPARRDALCEVLPVEAAEKVRAIVGKCTLECFD